MMDSVAKQVGFVPEEFSDIKFVLTIYLKQNLLKSYNMSLYSIGSEVRYGSDSF